MPALEWYGGLIAHTVFVELYEHSSNYFDTVKKVLLKHYLLIIRQLFF